jgi:hypothetical protein
MFDFYAQSSAHTRSVSFLHPKTSQAWPDMVRQSRDTDIADSLYKTSSDSPLSRFIAYIAASFHNWQLHLGHQPGKQVQSHKLYLPVKRHSTIHR